MTEACLCSDQSEPSTSKQSAEDIEVGGEDSEKGGMNPENTPPQKKHKQDTAMESGSAQHQSPFKNPEKQKISKKKQKEGSK